MTGEPRPILAEFQDFNGGPVAFGVQDTESLDTCRLPLGMKAILEGSKVVYRNKKDERGVVVRNKARLVAQGHRQEEEASDVMSIIIVMIALYVLTASRPDLMYLKGKPKLGLWYPRVSSFDLESYSYSDYAGANPDRKSTIGDKQLANVPLPLDHFPVNALTSKVFSFMVKKGKHFSGKVTPLFASMLVQPTEDEGAPSERQPEAQPPPSPAHTSEVPIEPQTDSSPAHTSEVPIEPQTDPSPRPSPSTIIPDSIPESSGGNLGGHSSSDKSLSGNDGENDTSKVYELVSLYCAQFSDQAKEIPTLEGSDQKLRSKLNLKFAKGEPLVHRDPLLDEIPEVTLDYMETENAQDVGRKRDIVGEEKENDEDVLSTEDVFSNDKEKVSTDKEKVSTDRPIVSTDGSKVYQAKAVSREKEKGVEFKDIEETDRPRPTSTRSL
ncbi:hypothetical protein Tco_0231265 [Tanacetum coccineum]